MDRNEWQELLSREEVARGYSDGFKLLYCPWNLIEAADTLFLSLNPGRDPSGELLRVASDERGNSYLVEREARHSPIAEQYTRLCHFIGRHPQEVLTGTLMPFRTDSWDDKRDRKNIAIAQPFWRKVLSGGRIRQVFCMGRTVEQNVVKMVGASLEEELPANWGNLTIRRYISPEGVSVFGLLHFSTYKMLSRPECVPQLGKFLKVEFVQ